jgi:hypothetical protein
MPLFFCAAVLWRKRTVGKRTPFLPRIGLGLLACGLAVGIFVAWEMFIAHKYGESHFLYALRQKNDAENSWEFKKLLVPPMLFLIGGLAPPAALLALTAFALGLGNIRAMVYADPPSTRFSVLVLAVAGALAVLGPTLLVTVYLLLMLIQIPESAWAGSDPNMRPASTIFGILGGLSLLALLAAALWQLLRLSQPWRWLRFSPGLWLLLCWIMIETLGYFAMTTFPASRRLMTWSVVAIFLAARLLSRSCRFGSTMPSEAGDESRGRSRVLIWLATIPGICLGFFYAGIDIADSWREPDAVHAAAEFIHEHDKSPKIWFVGHWGFQYAAERNGMKPLIPGVSELQPGDWLIVPNPETVNQQGFQPAWPMGEPEYVIAPRRRFPLRTIPAYYGGHLCLERSPDPIIEVKIYRISARWIPQ